MRPSEMVEGLDEVAKRSERQEQVDRIKQRSGRIIMNVAVHVDEKGRMWQRIVMYSLIGFVASAVALVVFLTWLANSKGTSAQEAANSTNAILAQYKNIAYQFEPVGPNQSLSVDEFKKRLTAKLDEQLKQRLEGLKSPASGRPQEASVARKAIHLLEMSLKFEDGFGAPFVFESKSPGVFVIRSTSKGADGGTFSTEVSLLRASSTQLESTAP